MSKNWGRCRSCDRTDGERRHSEPSMHISRSSPLQFESSQDPQIETYPVTTLRSQNKVKFPKGIQQ